MNLQRLLIIAETLEVLTILIHKRDITIFVKLFLSSTEDRADSAESGRSQSRLSTNDTNDIC